MVRLIGPSMKSFITSRRQGPYYQCHNPFITVCKLNSICYYLNPNNAAFEAVVGVMSRRSVFQGVRVGA